MNHSKQRKQYGILPKLAIKHGVVINQIKNVVYGRTYRHVSEPAT